MYIMSCKSPRRASPHKGSAVSPNGDCHATYASGHRPQSPLLHDAKVGVFFQSIKNKGGKNQDGE